MDARATLAGAAVWNTTTALTAQIMPITAETSVNGARSRTAPASGLSTVIAARRADLGTVAERVGRAQAVSAALATAETPEPFRLAGSPVSVGGVADAIANQFPMLSNHSYCF